MIKIKNYTILFNKSKLSNCYFPSVKTKSLPGKNENFIQLIKKYWFYFCEFINSLYINILKMLFVYCIKSND